MDRHRTVTIDLPEPMLRALGGAARAAGCSPSDFLRAVLRGALDRTPARLRPREEAVLLAAHLARDWVELQGRLRASGFVLRRAPEGVLALHSWPVERPLLRLDATGLGEAELTLRFGAGFPADAAPRRAVPRPGDAGARTRRGEAA
jgi:hypothetical protein